MCGIVGYVGSQQVAPILLDGLSKLEYRGYDSAGVAVYTGEQLEVVKAKGRLEILRDMLDAAAISRGLSASGIPAGLPTGSLPTSTPTRISALPAGLPLFTTASSKTICS